MLFILDAVDFLNNKTPHPEAMQVNEHGRLAIRSRQSLTSSREELKY